MDEQKDTLRGNLICLRSHSSERLGGHWNLEPLISLLRAASPTLLFGGKGVCKPRRGCGWRWAVGDPTSLWTGVQVPEPSPPAFPRATPHRRWGTGPRPLPPQFTMSAFVPKWFRVLCGMPGCYSNNNNLNNNNNTVTTITIGHMCQAYNSLYPLPVQSPPPPKDINLISIANSYHLLSMTMCQTYTDILCYYLT